MKHEQIIFEISQLAKWPGPITGIPRVMEELAVRFNKDGAVFVDWDPIEKHFYQIEFQSARDKRISLAHNIEHSLTSQKNDYVRRLVRLAKSKSSTISNAVESTKSLVRSNPKTKAYEFKKGDALFISWGEMIDYDYTDAVVSAHNSGAQVIQLIHDLIPIATPQFAGHTSAGMTNYLRKILPICKTIMTISDNTRRDIERWAVSEGVILSPINKFRLGDDFHFEKSEQIDDEKFISSGLKGGDYILSVGTVEARKNHYLYYLTYKLAKQKTIELPKIVIVGRRGWLTDDMYEIMTNDPDTKDSFVFLHNVNDQQLSWLFENCLFTLYVSFYEGWGLPIAESIARGVPVIASNTSSMVEVADGLASYYVSPFSPDECLRAIQSLLEPDRLHEEHNKIKAYVPVTWDTAYNNVKGAIEK